MSQLVVLLRLADNWDTKANPMTKNDFGVWEITLPAREGIPVIPHDSKVKVRTLFTQSLAPILTPSRLRWLRPVENGYIESPHG